jgi:hypothetical protein
MMQGVEICSVEPNSTKLGGLVSEIGGSRISKGSYSLGETMMTEQMIEGHP